MNYLPLFGRWATLSFVATVAAGATALSFVLDGGPGSEGAAAFGTALRPAAAENPWAATRDAAPQDASPPGQITVVNPDGSVRGNAAGLSTNPDGTEGLARHAFDDGVDRNRGGSDDSGYKGAVRRIE